MMNKEQNKKLLELLDISHLPPQEQEEMLLDMGDMVFRNAILAAIEATDEATKKEFLTLLEADASEDEIESFLEEKVPHMRNAVDEALAALADDILAVTKSNDN